MDLFDSSFHTSSNQIFTHSNWTLTRRCIFGTHLMWFATRRWSVAAQQNCLLRLEFCIKDTQLTAKKRSVHVVRGSAWCCCQRQTQFLERVPYLPNVPDIYGTLSFALNWKRSTHEIWDAPSQLFLFFFLLPIFGVVLASSCCLRAATTSRQIFFFFFQILSC